MDVDFQECPICSGRFGRLIDGPTCVLHTVQAQKAFVIEHKAMLRRRELGHREKYNSDENQLIIHGTSGNDGWAAGLEKRKENRT